MLVKCEVCGKEFEKRRHGPSKYCGAECRRAFELQEHHRKRAERGLPKLGDDVTCRRCGKPTTRRSRHGGAQVYCATCSKDRRQETTQAHKETDTYRIRRRGYDEKRKHDPKRVAQVKAWRATPRGRLDTRALVMVRTAIRKGEHSLIERSLGYTAEELHRHIERQFTDGMGWENMDAWHVDHIVPRSRFTYTSPDDAEFRAYWALTNLRPLWKQANVRKSAKRTHLL